MQIKGVLWHSTGANNPFLKRYVQPTNDNDKILSILGKNTAKNDWNHISLQAGVNAFIGKLANGSVTTVQTLPWDMRPWGCGKGKKGTCNDHWIQFECCEDSLKDKNYFNQVYQEGIKLTAYLCKLYNINPLGTVDYNGVKVPTILCHQDSYQLGLGSNHSDIYNWFNIYGKTMSDVRNDVNNLLNGKGVEEEVTQEQFNQMMEKYLEIKGQSKATWGQEVLNWGEAEKVMTGGKPNSFITRLECLTMLKRIYDKLK